MKFFRASWIYSATVALLLVLTGPKAFAEVVELHCKADDSESSFPLSFDLERNVLLGVQGSYPIVEATDEQITAAGGDSPNSKTGATVWIVNRTTGQFVMSAAGWFCDDNACKSNHLDNWVLKGTCQKNVF